MRLFKRKSGNGTWASQYIYVLVNWPFFWVTKIGITGWPEHRLSDIRKDSPGTDYYLLKVRLFGAYYLEQLLHILFRPIRVKWTGSGYTERFLSIACIPAVVIILLVKLLTWVLPFGVLYVIMLALSTTA